MSQQARCSSGSSGFLFGLGRLINEEKRESKEGERLINDGSVMD